MKLAYPYGTSETEAPLLGIRGREESVFPALREMGYTAIEPFVRNPKHIDWALFYKLVHQYGLEVAAIGTGPAASDDKLTFTANDIGIRTAAINRTKNMVEFASLFGCQVNIGKLRGDIDPHMPDQSWSHMRAAFEQVCEHADKYQVTVTLEPQNRAVINNLNTTREALAFIQALNIPNLMLMLDVFHMDIEDGSATEGFLLAKDKFAHIHLADSDRRTLGKGNFDIKKIVGTLGNLNYKGYMTVEIHQNPNSAQAARDSIDYLFSNI